MTSATSLTVRDPLQCLTGLAEVMRHLTSYGVSVTYADLPHSEIIDYDEDTGILLLRHTAPLYHQVWALRQIWLLRTFGPWMAPAVRRQPHLYLVPEPRTAS